MRRFINEGNDIKSAKDMKVAIESYGGVKGCYALKNFLFEPDGVRECGHWKVLFAGTA